MQKYEYVIRSEAYNTLKYSGRIAGITPTDPRPREWSIKAILLHVISDHVSMKYLYATDVRVFYLLW